MGFSGNGSIIVNTYSIAPVGHVDITFYSGPNGTGTDLGTYGLNYEVPAGGSGAAGGWYKEDSFLTQQQASGGVTRSSATNANLNKINSTISYLNQQVGEDGQFGSQGYYLLGNNCVDGVSEVLNMLGLPDNTASYMAASTLGVYLYARATATSAYIPFMQTNLQGSSITAGVRTAGQLLSWFGNTVDSVVTTALSLVTASGTDSNDMPTGVVAGQITVTVNPSNHSATVTYDDSSNVQIFDQNGNPLSGTPEDLGFPSDLVDDMISALGSLQDDFPLD